MKENVEIVREKYTIVSYRMFDRTFFENLLLKISGWLSLPFVYPLVLISKLSSEVGFKIASEFLSLIPSVLGFRPRYEFYRRTLRSCGKELLTWFGVIFCHCEVNVGNYVAIGRNSTIYHCDIGDNVMVAEGVEILAGTKYHHYDKLNIPMNRQGGSLKRIKIGNDVFIGSKSIVMANVGNGAVVGAGSVVVEPVEDFTIVAGNPSKVIGKRMQ